MPKAHNQPQPSSGTASVSISIISAPEYIGNPIWAVFWATFFCQLGVSLLTYIARATSPPGSPWAEPVLILSGASALRTTRRTSCRLGTGSGQK